MTLTVISILSLALVLAVVLGLLVRSLVKQNSTDHRSNQWSADWFEGFSATAYRPMKRLLADEDFRFLSKQPGYTPEMGRHLRKERRLVFRGYLRNLTKDFNRLYSGATILLVYSEVDRPELASSLLGIRANFYYALFRVHVRLAMHVVGFEMVDVTPMLQPLEFLQVQVRALQPAMMGASA